MRGPLRRAVRALGRRAAQGACGALLGGAAAGGFCGAAHSQEPETPPPAGLQITKIAATKPPATDVYQAPPGAGSRRPGLPDYKLSEVAKHTTKEGGVWVTFKDGVYDITKFIDAHPGGDRILLAAGASIEPFWQIYQVHRESEITLELLESMRIGNLDQDDRAVQLKEQAADPYAAEPTRHPALTVLSARPFNAEPPGDMLVSSYYTPQDLFYVRNHLPVPAVTDDDYRLVVEAPGMPRREFTLQDLQRQFEPTTVSATLQCAGNRRVEMNKVRQTDGLQWGDGAISNALWTGVRLSDVLTGCGVTEQGAEAGGLQHCQFEGYDKGLDGQAYGVSISMQRALTRREDVILAWAMNGETLSRDHGFPLRVICPGIVAARSVKWLNRIVLSDSESQTVWMQRDYKNIGPNYADRLAAAEAAAQAAPVREMPVQSAICEPENNEEISRGAGSLALAGYAWSGGGRGIQRVDVSLDGGDNWSQATLAETEASHGEGCKPGSKYGPTHAHHRSRQWSWTLWRAELPLDPGQDRWKACVKAVNTANDTQPETPRGIWNLRGLLNNSWHCIDLKREAD